MAQTFRSVWVWASLLTLSVVGRDTLDWWLSPTDDFYARSIVSTALAAAIFAGAGLWAALRLRSVRAAVLAGVATGLGAAVALTLISLGMLAVRHDPHTVAMIESSGGLAEVFLLLFAVMVPGTFCASDGSAAGRLLAQALPSGFAQQGR